MPPSTLELVLRAHPTQSQAQRLEEDNKSLLEILSQHGILFLVPRSLLRRQIVDAPSRTIALRAIACEIMHCAIPVGVNNIIKDLKWLRSVPIVGQEAMIHIVDIAITFFHWVHHLNYRELANPPRNTDLQLLEDLDDALLEMVCKQYYENSVYPNQWSTSTLQDYIMKITSLYLDPDWLLPAGSRRPRQTEFMARARRHMRKCHTHRLASMLANKLCGGHFPEELVEVVRIYLYDDEQIMSAITKDGTVIPGETNIEDLDKC